MANLKKYFSILVLVQIFLSYAPAAYAQTTTPYDYRSAGVSDQIKLYLCAPTEVTQSQTNYTSGAGIMGQTAFQANAAQNNANGADLYKCINQLYKFAIVGATVLGVFFLVIAGYIYMSDPGNGEGVTKGKNILETTITALVILFGGYLLLQTLNPDLVQFHSVQPPSVTLGPGGPTPGGSVNPTPPPSNGSVAPDVLTAAQTLLTMNGSSLSINASSCDCSGNCPINTLQTLAAGQQATFDGPGTTCNAGKTSVNLTMLNALISTANSGNNFTITSLTGGHHANTTDPHYKGNAVDLTPNPATATAQASLYNSLSGSGATTIAAECNLSTHIYTVLNASSASSYTTCVGQSGYHLHAQW